jgi:hypothetical protein
MKLNTELSILEVMSDIRDILKELKRDERGNLVVKVV